MLFSQRHGLNPIKNIIQIDSLDQDLRNALWSVVTVWRSHHQSGSASEPYVELIRNYWLFYFKEALDTLPDGNSVFSKLRSIFFDLNGEWYKCYDILQFMVDKCPANEYRDELINGCNEALERELAGWRFVETQLAKITSEAEIAVIEQAVTDSQPLTPVNEHLRTA